MSFILFISLLFSGSAFGLSLKERDKQLHTAVCFTISTVTYVSLRSNGATKTEAAIGAVVGAMFVGLVKEATDERVDPQDLQADFVGALAAPLFWGTF